MPRHHLTANACTLCRRKRTKCDGITPCKRCRSRGEKCEYEDKTWRTKDFLRSEIEKLRKKLRRAYALIRALTVGGNAEGWKDVMAMIDGIESPEEIARWWSMNSTALKGPESSSDQQPTAREAKLELVSPTSMFSPSIVSHSGSSNMESSPSLTFGGSPSMPDNDKRSPLHPGLNPYHLLDPAGFSFVDIGKPALADLDLPGPSLSHNGARVCHPPFLSSTAPHSTAGSQCSWTSMPIDFPSAHRVIFRYLTESFPALPFICRDQFMEDFRSGTPRYCSKALVNAILGLAFQSYDTTGMAFSSADFIAEAKRLLRTEDCHANIPSIQTFSVLALVELSLGNDDSAWGYVHECVRNSIILSLRGGDQSNQVGSQEHKEVMANTFCGASSLGRILRLLTGFLAPANGFFFMRIGKDDIDSPQDMPRARLERGFALHAHFEGHFPNCHPSAQFVHRVTEVVHSFATFHHENATSTADLEFAYGECLAAWKSFEPKLPIGTDITREALFAQIWYHYLLVALFRPFADDPLILRDGASPKVVYDRSSLAILRHADTYERAFTFRHAPAVLPHMVSAATLAQLSLASRGEAPNPGPDPKGKRHSVPQLPVQAPATATAHSHRRGASLQVAASHAAAASDAASQQHRASVAMGTRLLVQMGARHPAASETARLLCDLGAAGSADVSCPPLPPLLMELPPAPAPAAGLPAEVPPPPRLGPSAKGVTGAWLATVGRSGEAAGGGRVQGSFDAGLGPGLGASYLGPGTQQPGLGPATFR